MQGAGCRVEDTGGPVAGVEVWDGLLQAFKSLQEILREALPLKSPVIRLLTALYLGIRGRGGVWTVGDGLFSSKRQGAPPPPSPNDDEASTSP